MPSDTDEKTGFKVAEILASKHSDAWILDTDKLPEYDKMPDFANSDITEDVVKVVAKRLSGSAGIRGMDSHALTHWLLSFGKASCKLHLALASVGCWISNEIPPWAAYQALMAGCLVALDKFPGIHPLGIGETWRRLCDKLTLLAFCRDAA